MNSIGSKLARPSILFTGKLGKQALLSHPKSVQSVLVAHKSVINAQLKYAVASTFMFYLKAKKLLRGNNKDTKKKEYPKDTVILYQFPRAFNTPSLSPYALKLETWLRVAGIKYQNQLGMTLSDRGQIPFIRLNSVVVNDSHMCIEYLSKIFLVDLNSQLTPEQQAISRAVYRMCEESLNRCLIMHRFWHDTSENAKVLRLPTIAYWYFSYRQYRANWYTGFSRYTTEELYEIGRKDMKAIDTLIGDKAYLFSDTQPCDTDMALFGTCAQIKFNDNGPLNAYLKAECPNIERHVENIKNVFWKDWNANIRRKPKPVEVKAPSPSVPMPTQQ